MAAALFRRGTGLSCMHRELCRVVWRPQTALFTSKPPEKEQPPPRRTHIKTAVKQPAVDVAKLLEQLETTMESSPMEHTLSHPMEHTLPHPVEHTLPHPVEHTLPHPVEYTLSHPVEHTLPHPVEHTLPHPVEYTLSHPVEHTLSQPIEHTVSHPVEHTLSHPVEHTLPNFTAGTLETTDAAAVEGPVEPPIDAAAQKVETKSTNSGPVNLSHAAPLTLRTEPAKVSAEEPVKAAVEEEGNRSEEMALSSVTFHVDRVMVASFEDDELLQTISVLDEQAEEQARELLVRTEIGAESSSEDELAGEGEDERQSLTEVLSKWDSLSEDLQELEGESVKLLFNAPPGTATGAEAAALESVTLEEVGGLEAERESGERPRGVSEAVSREAVTSAEVEKESPGETTDLLEEVAEIVAGEQKTEVEAPPEETPEGTPEAPLLAEGLQTDALVGELLFSRHAPVTAVTGDQIGRGTVRANTSDATDAAGSVDVDAAPEVTDDVKEVLEDEEEEEEEEEEGAQAGTSGNEDGQERREDLDPVQRLFLEKIKEYNNMRRLNGGPLEAEPDYDRYVSEETAKLRRLHGGGDLSSFPQFTFTGCAGSGPAVTSLDLGVRSDCLRRIPARACDILSFSVPEAARDPPLAVPVSS
ncbi:ATP synthase-coupling factor 6, mitochondrial [Liparis tanakae]|uniref:ATP synthase peripheral stalk subunit F6, mitochondrial n=1 Tax=Liparis tanakae TaxID=230148 RepID=A0A4Z2IFQ6_9TELE|nr:ATP synthase-coupling factor 6, mitochondrial [Liparis tanakae]